MCLTNLLSLEEVSDNFAHWRRTKKPGEYIPYELWQQVKKIADNYRRSQITKRLGINIEQYRRYVRTDLEPTMNKASRAKLPPAPNTFVKIENNLSTQTSVALRLEFVRKDGFKLNCYCPNLETMHQTVEWFMRS